jgi:hypothetical protein
MHRRLVLVFFALTPSLLIAQTAKTPHLARNASLADTLEYLQNVLTNRDDIAYVTQSDSSDPHAVTWRFDSLLDIHAGGYVLDHSQALSEGDAQGSQVSFTPRYAAAPPDDLEKSLYWIEHFYVDFRNIRSVRVETLDNYLSEDTNEDPKSVRALPKRFAVVVMAGDTPFRMQKRYPRYHSANPAPYRPVPSRPGSRAQQAYIPEGDTDHVAYFFASKSAARKFAAALQHAVHLYSTDANSSHPSASTAQ